ncbi:MAG: alpha/beta fold hydrolase, partial [Candidatus Aminicenantes bacterium]|nr:alpha/beta fold hydrolase [Candidatus Aminicenantes bacterium]
QAGPLGQTEIVPESETRFQVKGFDAQLTFVRDGRGVVDEIVLFVAGGEMRGRRIVSSVDGISPPAPPQPVQKEEKTAPTEPTVESGRETVLDRRVRIEKEIVTDIPPVPRLCDGLNLKKRRVNVGDAELYVDENGRGVPVVLLHGGPGATHHYFHPSFARAEEFARVIYYDQRGCGLSDYHPGPGYTIAQAVDDLENLRRALGLESWVVLGHSYGGLLGQCYALKYPERVRGLILVTPSAGIPGFKLKPTRQRDYLSEEETVRMKTLMADVVAQAQKNGWDAARTREIYIFNNWLNGDWKRQNFYRPSREEIARVALYEWKQDKDFNSVMSRDQRNYNLEGLFQGCPIPTLVLEAKWDLTWNTDKPEKMAANHPGARLLVFEKSGHSPFADEPESFFAALKEFLADLPEVRPAELEAWISFLELRKKEKT